jgi:hypothetical protein
VSTVIVVDMNTEVLRWIKVASGDNAEAAKLDFYFQFWRLVKSSEVNLEDLEWIKVLSVNEAEGVKLDYVSAFWVQVKSRNIKLENTEDNTIEDLMEEIGSGILPQTIERKQKLWKKKRSRLLDEVEGQRAKSKSQKVKYHGALKEAYLKDVDDIQENISLKHSLLLAQLQDFEAYYISPSSRLQVLWHFLAFDFDQQIPDCPGLQQLESATDHTLSEQQAGGTIEPWNSSDIHSPQGQVQQSGKRKRGAEDYPPGSLAERPVNYVFRALLPDERVMTYAWDTNSAVRFLTKTFGQKLPSRQTEEFDYYDISSAIPVMLSSNANETPFVVWYRMIGLERKGAHFHVEHATMMLAVKDMRKPSYFHVEVRVL